MLTRVGTLPFLIVLVVSIRAFAQSPSISLVQWNPIAAGGRECVSGTGFGNTTGTVALNGTSLTPYSWSASQACAVIPSNTAAGTASLQVVNGGGASNTLNVTVTTSVPSVSSVSPGSAGSGVAVTIAGSNFGSTQGSSLVTINGQNFGIVSWSDTQIVATVPAGVPPAGGYPVNVTVNGFTSSGSLNILAPAQIPVISSSSPSAASAGATVTLSGSNFGSAQNGSTIALNGVNAPVQTWSDTAITAFVPIGASSGNWIVTVNGQQSNGLAFTVYPGTLIVSYSPTVASVTLTSPLALDWEHWGTSDTLPLVSNGVVSPVLTGFTTVGANSPTRFANGEIEYSWTDGDFLAENSRTTTGVSVTGTGNGFHLSIPVDTAPETLLLYVGAWEAQGHLTASLSDNSAPAFTDSSVDIVPSNGDHHVNGTYTLSFQAAQPGQTLNIDYVLAVDHSAATGLAGSISLQSAVLLPTQPSISLTSPTNGQTFTGTSSVPLAASASQIGAAINTVSFFSDSQDVFDISNFPYAASLQGLTAGDHTITARATDANGLTATSAPVLIAEVGTGGVLTGSADVPAAVDLSAGTSDWIHWGNSTPDRKAGVTPQISDFRTLANGSAHSFDASGVGGINYSWNSGTPTDSQAGTATDMRMQAYKNGFKITVAADTTLRTLKIYVSSGFGESTLRASLSDGSAAPFVSAFATPASFVEKVYTIHFQAASAGQTLIVTDQVTRDDGFVYVALESASVADQNAPHVDLVTPVSGQPGDTVTITGTNFGTSQPGASVSLNGTVMNVLSWSDSSISATVPLVQSGAVIVSRGLANSNGTAFAVSLPPPPVISSISPSAGNLGTVVNIFGSNFGSAQNNSTVTFNGIVAVPSFWSDTQITVPAPGGLHSGPVVVNTASGASNGMQFIFTPGARSSLQPVYVTPDESSLAVDGSVTFSVVDPSGSPVADATWSVDNSNLATISADPATPSTAKLQGLAPGEVTITANSSSLGTAQAKATIYVPGTIPAGTAAWGFYPQTQDNYIAATVKAFGSSTGNGPFLYMPEGNGAADATLLNAVDENGRLLWRVKLSPITPTNTIFFPTIAAGANDGGIILQTIEADPNGPNEATGLYHLGPDGKPLWTYSVPTVTTSTPAIGPDGTIYFWAESDALVLTALDGAKGTEKFKFNPLSAGSANITSSEQPGNINPDRTAVSSTNPWKPCAAFFQPGQFVPPNPVGGGNFSFQPIVGTDGSVYVMETVKVMNYSYDTCFLTRIADPNPNDPPAYFIDTVSGQLQYTETLQLLRISSGGNVAATQIGSVSYSGQAGFATVGLPGVVAWTFNNGASRLPNANFAGVVPGADGGALMTWSRQSSIPSDPPQGFLTHVLNDSPMSTTPQAVLGDMATNDKGTVFFDIGNAVTAVDIASGSPKWTAPGGLFAATNDGGALIKNNGLLNSVDQNGNVGTDSLPIDRSASYVAEGTVVQKGPAESQQLVRTSSPQLISFLASPWAITSGADPASTYRGSFYSKKVTIIGWIDAKAVATPPESSVNPDLVQFLNSSSKCTITLAAFSQGARGLITSDIDRQYANAFLITHSANNPPPSDLNPKSPIDPSVVGKGDYRAYNEVRVALYTQGQQITYALPATSKARLGDTPDPCKSFLTRTGDFFTDGTLLKPEAHPDNGQWGITPSNLHFFQLAEGRVGTEAQAGNMTLNACTSTNAIGICNAPVPTVTPYIWSFPLFDATGAYTVNTQIFPTYYIYEEGKLVNKIPQQALENFIKLNSPPLSATSQVKAKDIQ